jgi:hypothetical protein
MTVGPLPISDIIQVSVSAAAPAVAAKPFNQGLIVGPSIHIPSYGANARLQQFASSSALLAAGFADTDPEYLSAVLYFEQDQAPQFVWIGCQDLTAIQTVIPHSGNAGTGYAPGDIVTPTQSGASNAKLIVLTVSAGGVVTSLGTTIGNQGTGYSVASGLPTTTTGSGNGLEVDITVVGETLAQAVEACQLVNQQWYGFMCCGAVDADHLALAALSSANWQTLFYFGSTADADVVNGTAGNIALQMQALKDRALLSYNTTQGGTYPNNLFAAAAILGLAMGLNTGVAASAFTLNLKPLVGIAPEPLTQTQYNTLVAQHCNMCVSFGAYIGEFVSGILSSGEFFDQILYRAMLVNEIQTNLMNLLTSVPKIPQTDAGEHQLLTQVDVACDALATIGYLGPGSWTGPRVLNLQNGQALPLGYLNQAQSFAFQSAGDRAARKAMPIYSCILEAGAVHSVQVQVNVEL